MAALRMFKRETLGWAGGMRAFGASSQVMPGDEYKIELEGHERNEMTMLKAINDALQITLERNEK